MAWRRLDPIQRVEAFVADTWVETTASHVDEDSREARVPWPPVTPTHHLVLDRSRYRPLDEAGFARAAGWAAHDTAAPGQRA
jgi:hypothetical protein